MDVSGVRPTESDVRQSRNFDCAVRSDWKEVERWVSSASSWDFRSRSWGMGSCARSTLHFLLAYCVSLGVGR